MTHPSPPGARTPDLLWTLDSETLRYRLVEHVRTRCIVHSAPDRRLVDSRGRPQSWLFDLRPLLLDGDGATALARLFWERMDRFWPFQIAAQELAGVPLMGAILTYGALNGRSATGVIVRRERKTHGRQKLLEGDLSDLPVVLIDDIVNSGGSAERALSALRDEGRQVAALFTVVDFGAPGLSERMVALGVETHSLFPLTAFDIAFPKRAPRRSEAPLDIVWRFRPRRPSYMHVARKAAPVLAGDRVLHASEDGWLHALDLETGEPVWAMQAARRPGKGIWSTPLVRDGAVFVGSYDGVVYRLDLADGSVVWRFHGADWVGSSPAAGPLGKAIYIGLEHAIGGGSGGVARLDAGTGELVWEHRIGAQVHASPLVLPRGGVVCGANDGRVRLLDPDTGRAVWSEPVGDDVKGAATLSADGERLFVGACDGGVHALDRRTGVRVWRAATDGAVFGAPLVLGEETLAVSSTDGTLRRLAADDGRRIGEIHLGGKLFAAPVRHGGDLLVGSTDGRLSRVDAATLALAEQHRFPERITSEPAVSEGVAFVPTFDGQLFAVRSPAA